MSFWDEISVVVEEFDEEEMVRDFVEAFQGIVMSSTEMILIRFHGQDLEGKIKDILVLGSADKQCAESPSGRQPPTMGIILDATYVTFVKARDSPIKIRSGMKK